MDNALKYTPSGGAISVRVKQEKDDAVLVVADNGIGIAPEILPYIFDTFVQGNQSLARTKGGMGVGLSLAKKLVELHNGTIRVRSDGAGKGATFIVRLPASPSQPPAPEPKARTARSAAGYRILLVEDQDDGREMMKLLLTSLGHRVTTASDAEQALKAAAETHHDLVLSDIGLPGMDGYALAARLRADPATSKLKLVALTGYGLDTDKEKARQAGFDFHLTKPLRVADLQVCLDTLMG
jgi:CheY-like chemotaxis protein